MAEPSDELLQRYSAVLEQLATSPFRRELHLERIGLAKELGLADEVDNGRTELADHFPLSEGQSNCVRFQRVNCLLIRTRRDHQPSGSNGSTTRNRNSLSLPCKTSSHS